MRYVRVLDPDGVNGHCKGEVFNCPIFAAQALIASGRVEYAAGPELPDDVKEYASSDSEETSEPSEPSSDDTEPSPNLAGEGDVPPAAEPDLELDEPDEPVEEAAPDEEAAEPDEEAAPEEEPEAPYENDFTRSDLEQLTVPELRDLLRERDLIVSGVKDELINRLLGQEN